MVTDADYMRRALAHAARAQGATTPNPMVGAVIVSRDGVVVGQGRHPRAGDPHAEIFALREAGGRARGATLYVTLEPCSHQGRTGPCTHAIRDAGIARVVAAMADPNPIVGGQGFAELRAHGIVVEIGVLGEQAARLNRAFVTVHTAGRPMVLVKAATSLDARIAEAPGVRTHLTSRAADRRSQQLRASVDAIGVGSGTMLADNPLLTCREFRRARSLTRVVFDRRLRTPPASRVFSTLDTGPVIILTGPASADPEAESRARVLEQAGAVIVRGTGDLATDVCALLAWDVSSMLLEGGAALHAAAWRAGIVDRVHLIIAPVMLGQCGVRLFDGEPVPCSALCQVAVEAVGPDTWVESDVHRHH